MWPYTLCRPRYLVQHQKKAGQTWIWSCRFPSPGLSLLFYHSLFFDLQNHEFLVVPIGMGIPNASVSWHLSSPSPTYFPSWCELCITDLFLEAHSVPALWDDPSHLPSFPNVCLRMWLSPSRMALVLSQLMQESDSRCLCSLCLQAPPRTLLIPLWHFQCYPTLSQTCPPCMCSNVSPLHASLCFFTNIYIYI